jgi:hypothetical protein
LIPKFIELNSKYLWNLDLGLGAPKTQTRIRAEFLSLFNNVQIKVLKLKWMIFHEKYLKS